MTDPFISPLRIVHLFLEYRDRTLTERFLRGRTGLERSQLKVLIEELVNNEILEIERKGKSKRYALKLPETAEGFSRMVSLLSIYEEEWHQAYLDEREAREDHGPIIDATTGSISRFLDHMVFLEEIASIILTSRQFKQVFRETFRRLFSAVDFDIGFAITVESDLQVHTIHKQGISEETRDTALRSTRELLNLIVALPFIPTEHTIVENIEEMEQAPEGKVRHRIGSSFERDRMTPGLLALFRTSDTPFLADEKQVLDVLSSQMSLACRNINAHERIRQLALTDDLTGINNKRYFRLIYTQEFERAARYRFPLSLCMMDLDHFKSVNDRYGHQQGDVVLSEVAALILRMVRSTDVFARYGGEEFVLLLTHTEHRQGVELAERIRSAVEGYEFPGEATPINCTISIGVASLQDGILTPEDLMAEADARLYKAKTQGRNLVIST